MAEFPFTKKCQALTEPPKVLHHKRDFAHNFHLIYIVSRVFGLMPFNITYQANGNIDKPTITKFDGLWFSISICANLFGIYTLTQLIFPRGSDIYTSHLVILGDNLAVILGLFLGFFAVASDMNNRSKLVDIVNKIIAFDKKV